MLQIHIYIWTLSDCVTHCLHHGLCVPGRRWWRFWTRSHQYGTLSHVRSISCIACLVSVVRISIFDTADLLGEKLKNYGAISRSDVLPFDSVCVCLHVALSRAAMTLCVRPRDPCRCNIPRTPPHSRASRLVRVVCYIMIRWPLRQEGSSQDLGPHYVRP